MSALELASGELERIATGLEAQAERLCEHAAALRALGQAESTESSDALPRLLKAPEAAELLGVSVKRLYELAQRGEVPSVKLGERSVRFPLDALRAWVQEGGSA